MRRARSAAVLLSLGLGSAACPPGAVHVPAPLQPQLVAVRLVGNRVYGNITSSNGTPLSFTCPSLPTVENRGWELTPVWAPSLSAPRKQHLNRNAVITGDPTHPVPTGTCPGGGSRAVFRMCGNCAATHPAAQNVYNEGASTAAGTRSWRPMATTTPPESRRSAP